MSGAREYPDDPEYYTLDEIEERAEARREMHGLLAAAPDQTQEELATELDKLTVEDLLRAEIEHESSDQDETGEEADG